MQYNALTLFCNFVTRICALHFAFVILTLTGGVIFGFAPAVVTACVMLRRYLNGQCHIGFMTMFECYKKEFKKANLITLGLILPALSMIWYTGYFAGMDGVQSVFALALIPMSLLFMVLSYCALVMSGVYEANTFGGCLSNAFYLLLNHKLNIVLSALIFLGLVGIYLCMPVIGVFFGFVPVLFLTVGMYAYENNLIGVQAKRGDENV